VSLSPGTVALQSSVVHSVGKFLTKDADRFRRGKGTASPVLLAGELISVLAQAFPDRRIHAVGDAAYHGKPLLIAGATITTRLPAKAVLYALAPPRTGKRGRPQLKGDRIGGPAQIATLKRIRHTTPQKTPEESGVATTDRTRDRRDSLIASRWAILVVKILSRLVDGRFRVASFAADRCMATTSRGIQFLCNVHAWAGHLPLGWRDASGAVAAVWV
jgi:hypothetical protein